MGIESAITTDFSMRAGVLLGFPPFKDSATLICEYFTGTVEPPWSQWGHPWVSSYSCALSSLVVLEYFHNDKT